MDLLVNVDVADLPRATEFYVQALGLRVGRRFGDAAVELVGGSSPIYLLTKAPGSPPFPGAPVGRDFRRHWTSVHVDVVVADVEAAALRAQAAGATPEGGIAEHGWGRLAQFADPFGNGLCFLEFRGRGYDGIASPSADAGRSLAGGCHCGNVRVELRLSRPSETYSPRECDCDFCVKHGAAYVSDPSGALRLEVKEERRLVRYRQGSGTAECLLCSSCGVLVAVVYQENGRTYATVNRRAIEGAVFGPLITASPKKLETRDKVERWKTLWFSNVELVLAQTHSPNEG